MSKTFAWDRTRSVQKHSPWSFPPRLWNPKLFHREQEAIIERFVLDPNKSREEGVGLHGESVLFGKKNEAEGEADGAEGEAGEGAGGAEGDGGAADKGKTILGLDWNGEEVDAKTFWKAEFVVVVNQPVVVRSKQTKDRDIRAQLVERFGRHIPLHRCGVICCTNV